MKQKKAKSDGRGAQNQLIALMGEFGLTLPRNAADWRVASGPDGERLYGHMPGIVDGKVRVLCTDGLLAWVETGAGSVMLGHLANVEVEKQPREAGQGRKAKPPKISKSVLAALEVLGL